MRIGLLLVIGVLGLACCTNPNDLDRKPAYLGNFRLGHSVVVSPELRQGPNSREATPDEWIAAVETTVRDRFERYRGSRFYNLGINVEGYVLAEPGIPVVAAPKSFLLLNVTVWDDANAVRLNDPAETLTVFEDISGETIVGSGVTQTREQQIAKLSQTASKQIQIWLVQQNDEYGWFEDDGRPARYKSRKSRTRQNAAQPLSVAAPQPDLGAQIP
ncbi:MAG: hypothetical protein AAGA28_11110 [Pseudomonadota bacterium]